jgi:hypothetical protein
MQGCIYAHLWIKNIDIFSDENELDKSSLLHILLAEWIYYRGIYNSDTFQPRARQIQEKLDILDIVADHVSGNYDAALALVGILWVDRDEHILLLDNVLQSHSRMELVPHQKSLYYMANIPLEVLQIM